MQRNQLSIFTSVLFQVTQLRHPSGCAITVSSYNGGLGWFGTLVIVILCLFRGYLTAGAVYRFFYLHVRGIDIIPNLEFWASLPHRAQVYRALQCHVLMFLVLLGF